MSDRNTPEINAGSMADIAFLLLIFFLVTTTLDSDIGIQKMLAAENTNASTIKERNVLEIAINANNEIQLDGAEIIPIENLRQFVVDFIDNGASKDQLGNPCDWCNGKKDVTSSDHPAKAVVALESSRSTSYGTYIATHNEINNAYAELRTKLAQSLYGISYKELVAAYKKDKNNSVLKSKIENIKNKYPVHIFDKEAIK